MKKEPYQKPHQRTSEQIDKMEKAGRVVAHALALASQQALPGIPTADIDQTVERFFKENQVTSLFKGYKGFPAVTCLSINEQVVHGVPGTRTLKEGDLLKIDTACKIDGWCADSATTVIVSSAPDHPNWEKQRELMRVTREVLQLAITSMANLTWWSDVARRMHGFLNRQGYTACGGMAGHGIGHELHEPPAVPNSWLSHFADFRLVPGVVIAIEPMVTAGKPDLKLGVDGWTMSTIDGSLSAHFEHTIAITEQGPRVLTSPIG